MSKKIKLLLVIPASLSTPCFAETIQITNIVPAKIQAALEVDSIALGSFDGNDGVDLKRAIERAVNDLRVEGRPYFKLLSDVDARNADIILRGSASANMEYTERKEIEQKCDKKDKTTKKCIKYYDVTRYCRNYTLKYFGRIDVFPANNEKQIYEWQDPRSAYDSNCDLSKPFQYRTGSNDPSAFPTLTAALIKDMAAHYQIGDYEIAESRKGLMKAHEASFKYAVKLTKTDANEACNIWLRIDRDQPNHPATTYNSALCHERMGNYDKALIAYQLASQLDKKRGSAERAMLRIGASKLGRAQLQKRGLIAR